MCVPLEPLVATGGCMIDPLPAPLSGVAAASAVTAVAAAPAGRPARPASVGRPAPAARTGLRLRIPIATLAGLMCLAAPAPAPVLAPVVGLVAWRLPTFAEG